MYEIYTKNKKIVNKNMKNPIKAIGKWTYGIWSKFLDIIGDIKVFKWPMFIVYDPSYFQMTGPMIQEAMKILRPGDIVLRGYDHYLDGHFINGDYSHGSVCTGPEEITHAVSPKVCTVHPIDFMECDRICILRPKDQTLVGPAVEKAKSLVGTPYDFGFNTGDPNEVYCFELAARSYPSLSFKKYTVKYLLGLVRREVYLGKSFLQSGDLKIVFEYNPRKGYVKSSRARQKDDAR